MAVGELLLQLTGQAKERASQYWQRTKATWVREGGCLPLLNPVEALQGWDGDKNDNSLLAVANLDLKIQSQHASSRIDYKDFATTSMDRFPSCFLHVCVFYGVAATRRGVEERL